MNLPALVAHADWSVNHKKRWLARAELDSNNCYLAYPPEPVGEVGTLLRRLAEQAGLAGCALIGFDFPIGLPLSYAEKVGIEKFLALLPRLGQGQWHAFYDVAARRGDINLRRPFYPKIPGGTRQQHLLDGLGLTAIEQLRRRCEIYREGRRAASPLFWTLGGQQVGKAAITGWRDVLAPGLSEAAIPLAIWPFEGRLAELCRAGNLVALETYPTEFYTHLGVMFSSRRPGRKSGKRVQEDRAANFQRLSSWAKGNDVALHPALVTAIRAGFGSARDGEDQFDAVIGLFGMLNVVLGNRGEGWPIEDRVREVEGWILGQSPGDQNGAPLPF